MAVKSMSNEAEVYWGSEQPGLRKWGSEENLYSMRNLANRYQQHDREEQAVLNKYETDCMSETVGNNRKAADSREIRKAVNKLHCIIRDGDADSNIVTRFDEISKLLFLRLILGKKSLERGENESEEEYADKVQKEYLKLMKSIHRNIPLQFNKIFLSNSALCLCGKELCALDIDESNCDVKGLAYEDTIKGTFDKSDNQQYFTPYQIVNFMVAALKRYLSGRVCDPACGTAGFLIRAHDYSGADLTGLEVDERLAWVSTLNLLIHGAENFETACLGEGGSLGDSAGSYFGKMDVVLTNPPFGSDYTEPKILDKFDLGRNKKSRRRGILFIEQAWNLLKNEGMAAIIIDQGVLNSNSNTDVREYIFSHFLIMGIIDLPESCFLPYASVHASILILQKKEKGLRQGKTFFAKSLNIGRKPNGDDDIIYYPTGESRLNSDLPAILEDWNSYLDGNEIMSNGSCFVADIGKYLAEDKSMRFDYIFHHPFRTNSKEIMNKSKSPLVTLEEICEERNQSYNPSADPEATSILFTGLANIESNTGIATQELIPAASIKSTVKRYEPHDIIFSKMRPAMRKVAVMNMKNGGYVSSECTVFIVKKCSDGEYIINPEILSALLRSDFVYGQIMTCVKGIGRPRISGKDLRKIKVPLPAREIQDKVIENLRENQFSVKKLKDKSIELAKKAENLEMKMIDDIVKTVSGGI